MSILVRWMSLDTNETPDENTPCFDIKTHVCLYQNYNTKSKNLNIAVYCHQLTTVLIAFTLLFLIYSYIHVAIKNIPDESIGIARLHMQAN